jgi:hypothetical protein
MPRVGTGCLGASPLELGAATGKPRGDTGCSVASPPDIGACLSSGDFKERRIIEGPDRFAVQAEAVRRLLLILILRLAFLHVRLLSSSWTDMAQHLSHGNTHNNYMTSLLKLFQG